MADYMDTKRKLLASLAAHYGLPEDQLMEGTTIQDDRENPWMMFAVFRVAVSEADLIAACKRMEPKPAVPTSNADDFGGLPG